MNWAGHLFRENPKGQGWISPWVSTYYFQSLGLLTVGDLPMALAGRTNHKAGTSSPGIKHTGARWFVATRAEVVGSLAGNG